MTRGLAAGMSGWVVCYGCWTGLALLGIALHAPLSILAPVFLLCLLAGAFAGWRDYRADPKELADPHWQEASPASRGAIGLAVLATAALPFTGAGTLKPVWAAAALALTAMVVMRDRTTIVSSTRIRTGLPDIAEERWEMLLLLATVLLAVGVTVLSNRSDADDYRYLWMAIRPDSKPDDPILFLYNRALLRHPDRFPGPYTWHPYEVLVAALAYLGGVSAELPYYYWLPPLNAVLTVVELYLCARLFLGRQAALAAFASTLLLIAWGEGHRDIGNFAFVRLFQGKALLVSWAVPMIFRLAVRLARERNGTAGALLAAAILAGCGTTHTGMVVAPLTAVIGLFAGWASGKAIVTLSICAASAGLTQAAAAVATQWIPFGKEPDPTSAATVIWQVFPPDARSVLALSAAVLSCLLLQPASRRLAGRALLLGAFLALNPFVMESLSRFNASLTWRVLWAFPFASFAGIGFVAVLRTEMNRWRLPVLSTLIAAVFLAGGIWTTSEANGNHFGDLGLKADDTLKNWLKGNTDFYIPRDIGR